MGVKAWAPLAAAAATVALIGAASAADAPLTAKTTSGQIEGVAKDGSAAFLGVPYAAPPTGAARWRPPAPAARWTGVRKTVAFAPSCPQVINPPAGRAPWTPEYLIPGATSEDCLYLNVWRPLKKPTKPAPILVWIHGGGFVEGSGSVPVYDGAALASRGVVVVAINYRLGVLGFLSHPALSQEQGGRSGNYGLEDIIASLRWVKANAPAFGGDPARVTISGQSAGSGAVTDLVASPEAKGLFWRAITESGSGWAPGMNTLAKASANGEQFAKKIGATSLDALRAMPADALVKAAAGAGARFGAVVDGKVLPLDPYLAVASGKINDTPILSGANADEGSGFESDYGHLTMASLAKARDQKAAPMQAEAAKFYSASSDAEAAAVGKTMAHDRSSGYGYEWAKRRAAQSKSPIYLYFFDHPHPGPTMARYGTFHTSEVPYVFHNLSAPRPFADKDRQIADDMSARWISFISGGAPNAPGKPNWPAFKTADPKIMLLGDKEGPSELLTAEKRRFFDAIVDGGGKLARY